MVAEPARASTEAAQRSERRPTPDPTYMSYADFGRRFFQLAVTRDRVAEAVEGLGGRPIDVGPLHVASLGPISLVKVRAHGRVREPQLHEVDDPEHVAFRLTIPVDLQMQIHVSLDTYRFAAEISIVLPVRARAAEPLRVVIDVEPPTPQDVEVRLQAKGLRASVLQSVAGVEGELKRAVSKFVANEVAEHRDERIIDVAQSLATQ